MPNIQPEKLAALAADIFAAVGVPQADARLVADSLVGANLRGHDSHGVMRVTQYVDYLRKGQYRPVARMTDIAESEALLATDGHWSLGQVLAHKLLDRLFPKLQALGTAVGTGRFYGHVGRLGEYAERAAARGAILVCAVNNNGSGQRVAPPGGVAPRLGTNPLCVGIPAPDRPPLVLDFGTSVAAEGKVRAHLLDNRRPVPDGWLLDPDGNPTNDPGVIYQDPPGTILPMGGFQAYKGFGLGLAIDLLSAGLSGGLAIHPDAPPVIGNNILFILVDPARLAGAEHLLQQAGIAIDYVRNTPRKPDVPKITLPGDPEQDTLAQRTAHGIPIPPGHLERLQALADELGIPADNLQ